MQQLRTNGSPKDSLQALINKKKNPREAYGRCRRWVDGYQPKKDHAIEPRCLRKKIEFSGNARRVRKRGDSTVCNGHQEHLLL